MSQTLLEECLQHHGHKGDPGVTPQTCGTIAEKAQVILVWVGAPGVGNASTYTLQGLPYFCLFYLQNWSFVNLETDKRLHF